MTYQAAIFDMDGLLLDTERVALSAFEKACQTLSVPFLKSVYLGIIGQNAQGIEKTIQDGYGPSLDYATLREAWMVNYHGVIDHQAIPVKEGVIDLLEWLKVSDKPIAVATSSSQHTARTKLKLAGLAHYFDSVTTGCEVSRGKPDPEIFQLSAKRMKVSPSLCLGFEDSNNGVRAGVAAGLKMFQVPDLVKPTDDVIKLGHTILPSLTDVLQQIKTSSN